MVKNPQSWRLDPAEVEWRSTGSSSGRRKRATRSSRAASITGATVTLWHVPTGLSVEGEIPRGHYTKNQMLRRKQSLYDELFPKLEALVAARLKNQTSADN